ncbi:hypothetical protein LINPERPRIM_LOCUS21870 [Linum perenne]
MLKKYFVDPSHVILPKDVEIEQDLTFEGSPVRMWTFKCGC